MKPGPTVVLSCVLLVPPAVAGVEDTFDYFVNNWNVIGLPDYFYGSRITPDNEMYLANGTAVRIRVGSALTRLSRANGKRARDGWMPIMDVTSSDGAVRYHIAYWATPLPDVKDWQKAFGWPTEGENYLNWVSIQATNTSTAVAEARADVRPDTSAYADRQAPPWGYISPPFESPRKHSRQY